jgi:hypothetical protein
MQPHLMCRILSQTTPENTCKNFSMCSIDPSTRYPTLNLKLVLPFQVTKGPYFLTLN